MNLTRLTKTRTTLVTVLTIAAIGMLVSSTAIAKPALASSNSVSKSDIRDVRKFLQCVASHGGNDISKSRIQRCIDNYLGGNNNNNHNHDNNNHNH